MLAALLLLEIAAGHRQFPWRANQNRSSNTHFVKISRQDQTFSFVLSFITVEIQLSRVVLRVRNAFGVPGVRVPRRLFPGTAPPAVCATAMVCSRCLLALQPFLMGQKNLRAPK